MYQAIRQLKLVSFNAHNCLANRLDHHPFQGEGKESTSPCVQEKGRAALLLLPGPWVRGYYVPTPRDWHNHCLGCSISMPLLLSAELSRRYPLREE